MTGVPWWVGHPPIAAPLGAPGHVVRWADGELALEGHPDPVAERALAALGGERCLCLDVHEAWVAQHDDPSVLVIGRRRPTERLRGDESTLARFEREEGRWRQRMEVLRRSTRGSGAEHAVVVQVAIHRLLALHPDFEHRLQLTVCASAEQRWADEGFRLRHGATFAAALASRAAPALAAAGLPVDPSFVDLLPPEDEPEVPTGGGPVRLPLRWLTRVWGRGVACVDGRFVTDVHEVLDGGRRLLVSEAGGGKLVVSRGVGTSEDDWRITRA